MPPPVPALLYRDGIVDLGEECDDGAILAGIHYWAQALSDSRIPVTIPFYDSVPTQDCTRDDPTPLAILALSRQSWLLAPLSLGEDNDRPLDCALQWRWA